MSRYRPSQKPSKPFRRSLHSEPESQWEWSSLFSAKFWKKQVGIFWAIISIVFIILCIPNFINSFTESDLFENSNSFIAQLPTAIPIWYSSFEKGFPGEWFTWDSPAYKTGMFSRNGQPTGYRQSYWTILNQKQAQTENIRPIQGNHLYKGLITGPETDGQNHRAYPVLHLEEANPEYVSQRPIPVVNRFYTWVDWDRSKAKNTDWMHFLTLGNNPQWQVVTMSMVGPQGRLELAHIGEFNQFKNGNGWETINGVIYPIYMPLRQWVRFTVYVDYQQPLMVVWMDGQPIFRANGGNLRQLQNSTLHLLRAHWGLYANPEVSNGKQYNDSIQIWGLTKPLSNFAKEPLSPYDGRGF